VLDLGNRQSIPVATAVSPGRKLIAGIRPEHMTISAEGGRLRVPVAVVESTGSASYITTATELSVVESGRSGVVAGETIGLDFAPEAVHVFDAETERRL
jgi:multiple sugar transport system ATP-binding protein